MYKKETEISKRLKGLERKPRAYAGEEYSVCINVECDNYGLAEQVDDIKKPNISYKLTGGATDITCKCNELGKTAYSNYGVYETAYRTSDQFLFDKLTSCPHECCYNHMASIYTHKEAYTKFGKNNNGKQRYKCKECNKPFVVEKTTKQYKSKHNKKAKKTSTTKNKRIFLGILEGLTMRSNARICEVSTQTIYDKLDFFSEKSRLFNHKFDEKLKKLTRKHTRIETDTMQITTNWRDADGARFYNQGLKNGLLINRLVSAEGVSGFIMAQTNDFDRTISSTKAYQLVEGSIRIDEQKAHMQMMKSTRITTPTVSKTERRYPHWQSRADKPEDQIVGQVELKSRKIKQSIGVMFMGTYYQVSHYLSIKELVKKHKNVYLMSDGDSTNQILFHNTFHKRIKDDTLRGYQYGTMVQQKEGQYSSKKYNLGKLKREQFKNICRENPFYRGLSSFLEDYETNLNNGYLYNKLWNITPSEIRILSPQPEDKDRFVKWIKEYELKISNDIIMEQYNKIKDNVFQQNKKDDGSFSIQIPNPRVLTGNPNVIPLTDGRSIQDKVRFFTEISNATTHSVDNYFNWCRKASLIRRKQANAMTVGNIAWEDEKTIFDPTKAYDPNSTLKIGDMQRFYWNFVKTSQRPYETEPKTPAMRLGLVKRPMTLNKLFSTVFFGSDPYK